MHNEISLPNKLESELEDSRVVCRSDLHKRRGVYVQVRRLEVDSVESVKHLKAELRRQLLLNWEIFVKAKIRRGEARTEVGVATHIPERPQRIGCERRRVQPRRDLLATAPPRGEVGVADKVRSIRADAAQGVIDVAVHGVHEA